MPTKDFNPLPHAAARDHIAGLPLVSRDVLDEMMPELKAYFFCVKGIESAEQLSRIRKHLADVPDGASWDVKRKAVAAELADAMDPKQAARRAETLLRTHVYRAYAAARYRTLMSQRDIFPFWMYKTHGDGKVRPAHAALNGKVFPAGHAVWQTIFPPWGWGCRCLIVPLTARAAARMGQGAEGMESEPQAPSSKPQADDGLLPTQRAKPEIYTPHEADVIAKANRLPGGISLEPEPSWGRSPWSEKGGIKHTWEYVQHLYGDDPVVLETFRQWAAAKALPDMGGATVLDWLEAENAERFLAELAGPEIGLSERIQQNRLLVAALPARESPVSAKLIIKASGVHGEAMRKAGILIDHVHDDGKLGEAVVSEHVTGDVEGQYRPPVVEGGPAQIGVRPDSKIPLVTAMHEIGHHIRHRLDPRVVTAVKAAANKGSTMRRAARYATEEFLSEGEVFSRSYAQYIAKRSRGLNDEAWHEVELMLSSGEDARFCFDEKEWPAIEEAITLALQPTNWQ